MFQLHNNLNIIYFYIGRREAAIVTELPGTTRDPILIPLDMFGYSVLLIDTAGIHTQTNDLIEELGMKKSMDQAQEANMIILVTDVQYLLDVDNIDVWLQRYAQNMKVQCKNCVVYVNKIDVVSEDQVLRLKKISQVSKWNVCFGSCKIDNGLTDIMDLLENSLQKLLVIL